MKLRRKIYIVSLTLISIVVLSMSYFIVQRMYSSLVSSKLELLNSIANIQKSRLEEYIANTFEEAKMISRFSMIDKNLSVYNENNSETLKNNLQDSLKEAVSINNNYINVLLFDKFNNFIVSSNDYTEQLEISNSFEREKTDLEDIHFKVEDQEPFIYVHTPIIVDDIFVGTLAIKENAKEVVEIAKDYTGLGETGETVLASHDDNKINYFSVRRFESSSLASSSIYNPDKTIPIVSALNKIESTFNNAKDYRDMRVLAVTKYLPAVEWGLVVKQDRKEIYTPVYYAEAFVLLLSLVIWIFVFLLLRWALRIIFVPLARITDGMQIVGSGNLNFRFNNNNKDEIADISRFFDSMIDKLQTSRRNIDLLVKDQTKDIISKNQKLEDQQWAMLNILEDVEEEKNNTEKNAQELEKFMLAVENASDHIVITDLDGIIIYANTAVQKITGFNNAEVVGAKAGSKALWGGLMEANFYKKLWNTIKNRKKTFTGEIKNKKKDGQQYDAAISIAPVFGNNEKVLFFVGIERDITKEKDVDRAKTEFVSLASHQLRTPLSSINWYSEMLLDGDVGKLNKDQELYVNEIYSGNQRMVELVNALLNVSRLELGTFSIEPEDINIDNVIDSLVSEMTPLANKKNIKVTKIISKEVPMVYSADKSLFRIIIQNFLSNSIKYTPERGKISILIEKKNKDLVISVKDNGYGIPKNQENKIFSKLFRADNIRQLDTEGTGLGLYIIKQIVEACSGSVGFISKENKGTTFFAKLPAKGMKEKKGSKQID